MVRFEKIRMKKKPTSTNLRQCWNKPVFPIFSTPFTIRICTYLKKWLKYKEHVSTKTVDAQFIYSLCISIYKRSSSGEILQNTPVNKIHNPILGYALKVFKPFISSIYEAREQKKEELYNVFLAGHLIITYLLLLQPFLAGWLGRQHVSNAVNFAISEPKFRYSYSWDWNRNWNLTVVSYQNESFSSKWELPSLSLLPP